MSLDSKKIIVKGLRGQVVDIEFYLCFLRASDVIAISYAAVRGKSDEPNAVQRPLNRQRVSAIREFVLRNNWFYSAILLNWVSDEHKLDFTSETEMAIALQPRSAQIIDGQHRLAGVEDAIKTNPLIGDKRLIVALCKDLSIEKAADLFIKINTEQRPVPQSLIYDLFGSANNDSEHEINRARDVIAAINERESSPYRGFIKYPTDKTSGGYVSLSSAVNALKPLVKVDGEFSRYSIRTLENQIQALINYFTAIQSAYDRSGSWRSKTKNPFLSGIGFLAAVLHFSQLVIPECINRSSFEVSTFEEILNLSSSELLMAETLKELDGKSRRERILSFLRECTMARRGPTTEESIRF